MCTYPSSLRRILRLIAPGMLCLFSLPEILPAQDIDPPGNASSTFANALVDGTIQVTQSRFLLGWNWNGATNNISNALGMNGAHGGFPGAPYRYKDQLLMLFAANLNLGFAYTDNPLTSLSMHYAPSAAINATTTATLENTVYPNSSAFGFLTRDSRGAVTGGQHSGYGAYELHSSDFTPSTSALVLASPWPDNVFYHLKETGFDDDPNPDHELTALSHTMNGRHFYVSINLRLLSGGGSPEDDILRIAVPYSTTSATWADTEYINFYSTPTTGSASYPAALTALPDGRGYALSPDALQSTTGSVTSFTIKRYMLSGISSSSVTISAFFILSQQDAGDPTSNPSILQQNKFEDPSTIKHLGLEITYLGHADVAINWAGFETPHARSLFLGEQDHNINTAVNATITQVQAYNATTTDQIHIHRFYLLEERPTPFWGALRYGNALVQKLGATETAISQLVSRTSQLYLADYFAHEIQFKEFWPGSMLSGTKTPAPYIWHTKSSIPTTNLGLEKGYFDNYNRTLPPVPGTSVAPSQYEIYLSKDNTYFGNYDAIHLLSVSSPGDDNIAYYQIPEHEADYEKLLLPAIYHDMLMSYESYLYFGLYKEPGMIYNTQRNWWVNVWEWSNWGLSGSNIHTPGNVLASFYRAQTAEELRYITWAPLILGAKGLVYYKAQSKDMTSTNNLDPETADGWSNYQLGEVGLAVTIAASVSVNIDDFRSTSGTIDYTAYLKSDQLGIDFLESTQNSYHTHDDSKLDMFIDDINATADSYDISADRIYLGRKSHRLEVKKINDRIRSVDDELMHLQLKAWYAKGFLEWNSSASTASWSAFTSFVDVTGATTRQIGRMNSDGQPEYENRDSSFFDITYLENTTNGSVVIGVQNRRTDPVVLVTAATVGGTYFPVTQATIATVNGLREYRFYTTEEFDRLATTGTFDAFGGEYAQLGCRELRLPFQYQEANEGYALIRVQELGGGIDTTIGQDRALAVKLKPGEGKLLRLTVLHNASATTGSLDYSNQRKLVCAPDLSTLADTTDFRYHMVYHASIPGSFPPRQGVYYRRSVRMKLGGTNDENIIWEAPLLLSGAVQNTTASVTVATMECAYPSLMVQNSKVYAVYACTSASFLLSGLQTAIVESNFSADATTQTIGSGRTLALAAGSDLSRWGTPVINASAPGQYYAWSDAARGIVAGFKLNGVAAPLTATTSYSWLYGQDGIMSGSAPVCTHPSVNTYSRITSGATGSLLISGEGGEDECALVWEEDIGGASNIYYARLQCIVTTATMKHYGLPQLNSGQTTIATAWLNSDLVPHNVIARLSEENCSGENYLPVIYRTMETYNYGSTTSSLTWEAGGYRGLSRRDIIFWEGKKDGQSFSRIYMRRLEILDHATYHNDSIYDRWNVWPLGSMWHWYPLPLYNHYNSLHRPDLAQGLYIPEFDPKYKIESANLSDSAFVTNFIDGAPSGSIYQMTFNLFSPFLQKNNGVLSLYWHLYRPYLPKSGFSSHLSARPFLRSYAPADIRLNRRVFEEDNGGHAPFPIATSSELFYKITPSVEQVFVYPGYAKPGICAKYAISHLGSSVDGIVQVTDVFIRIEKDTSSGNRFLPFVSVFPDTLKSDSFVVGSFSTLSFDAVGEDTSFVKMDIVRLSDGDRQRITLPVGTDSTVSPQTLTLIGGGGDEYRIEFLKTDTAAEYTEDYLLTRDSSEGLPKLPGRHQVINLGRGIYGAGSLQMIVYPNPAKDQISIGIGSSESSVAVEVEIINTLGMRVGMYEAHAGGLLTIDVQNLVSGLYHVRVHSMQSDKQTTGSFVIRR